MSNSKFLLFTALLLLGKQDTVFTQSATPSVGTVYPKKDKKSFREFLQGDSWFMVNGFRGELGYGRGKIKFEKIYKPEGLIYSMTYLSYARGFQKLHDLGFGTAVYEDNNFECESFFPVYIYFPFYKKEKLLNDAFYPELKHRVYTPFFYFFAGGSWWGSNKNYLNFGVCGNFWSFFEEYEGKSAPFSVSVKFSCSYISQQAIKPGLIVPAIFNKGITLCVDLGCVGASKKLINPIE